MSRTLLPCDLTLVGFSNLDSCFVWLLMSSLAQWRYEFELDTEKQRQFRCDVARLIENGNARSKQLLVMPTESLTNRENGCQESSWVDWSVEGPAFFLDMKYLSRQTWPSLNASSIWPQVHILMHRYTQRSHSSVLHAGEAVVCVNIIFIEELCMKIVILWTTPGKLTIQFTFVHVYNCEWAHTNVSGVCLCVPMFITIHVRAIRTPVSWNIYILYQ